jgi:HlyD family secretion protein
MKRLLHALARQHPRKTGAASLAMVFLASAALFVVPRPAAPPGRTATVREGTFRETLVEPGTLSSSRLLLYGSSIAGVQVKIVEIAPESQVVKPGDVLVRFDSTTFEQNLAREEASLRQAQSELLRAREELRIERLRLQGESAQAHQQVQYAQAEVANQTDGKGRVQQAELEAAEADAARELQTAKAQYEDMQPLLARGFITRLELDRAEQGWKRAEEQLRLAQLRREAMAGFERPAATARSKAELDAAQEDLVRQQESARARISEHEAAVGIAQSRIDEIAARATLLRDQIARCVVRSEAAGMVVYRELYFGNDRRKPQVGDEVWSNQPLIALPDTAQLTVETRIREVDLHHVRVGGPVAVTLPAYPDLAIDGSISLVGALAEPDATRAESKFFPVTVALHSEDPRLRTGMTARVSIEVASLPRATLAPVQAIFDVDGRPSVFVLAGKRPEARQVEIVAENNHEAAIADGVAPGDVVLLADPRAAGGSPSEDGR